MGVLEIALDIVFRLDLPVFPCGKNKKPVISKDDGGHGFLDATNKEDEVRALFARTKAAKLVGVPTGPISGFDILDIDPRHGGDKWEMENAHRLPETRMHGTLSGGRHYLFKHAPGVRNSASKKTLAPGVDVRGEGGYVIYPPSSGYHIIADADLVHWPDWLLALVLKHLSEQETPKRPEATGQVEINGKRLEGYINALTRNVKQAGEGSKHYTLRNTALALGGVAQSASLSDEQCSEILVQALPNTVQDWKAAKETIQWGLTMGRKKPLELEDSPAYAARRSPSPPEEYKNGTPAPIEWLPKQEWRDDLAKSESGKILRTLSNVMIAFRQCEIWVGLFAWNQFSSRLMVTRHLPGPLRPDLKIPRELGDADISNVTDWLQRNGIIITSLTTKEAIRAVAEDNAFHPVRDYLRGLKWDGSNRLDLWMVTHLGVENKELHRAFSARWMIGLVARVERPGCQLDTALILESRQGLRKSTALRTLAEPWFTDHVPDLGNKDALAQLQGVWIVELAEMTSFSKAETARIKSFLSTRVDRFRPSYAPVPVDHPRQCGFAGTINPGSNGYLRDETGGRRFWIVACAHKWPERKQINVAAIARERDQLWAEAVHRYNAGEVWWLDNETLEKGQEEAAEARQADDPREPRIRVYIKDKPWVRMDQILGSECLNVPPERWTIGLRMEIGAVLIGAKWQRKRKRVKDSGGEWEFEWRYWPPGSADDEPEPSVDQENINQLYPFS